MKKFETITEKNILYYAYDTILGKWLKEKERIESNPESEMPIAKHWKKIYKEQLDEINTRILELEKAE